MFLIGSATFAVPAGLEFVQNPNWISKITILGILGLLFITILSTITAFFFFEWGIEKLGLARAQVFQYIQPAIAATIAVPLLQERVSFSFVIGTILVILGVYWGTLGKEEHHHKKWSGTRH